MSEMTGLWPELKLVHGKPLVEFTKALRTYLLWTYTLIIRLNLLKAYDKKIYEKQGLGIELRADLSTKSLLLKITKDI